MGTRSSRNRLEAKVQYQREAIGRLEEANSALRQLLTDQNEKIQFLKRRMKGKQDVGHNSIDRSGDSRVDTGVDITDRQESLEGTELHSNTEVNSSREESQAPPEHLSLSPGDAASDGSEETTVDDDNRTEQETVGEASPDGDRPLETTLEKSEQRGHRIVPMP